VKPYFAAFTAATVVCWSITSDSHTR
jgi:hypothetical protein